MTLQQKRLILVVEDGDQYLKLIELTLRDSGYEVRTARTGAEALTVLSHCTPTVIVLDIGLPGISGIELCRQVKEEPRLRQVPIVFLTGRDSPEDFKAAYEAGGVFCMSKLFGPERLLNFIDTLSSIRRIADPGQSTP